MKKHPKILIITMYCGEPQLERCLASVNKQINVSCEYFLISNKPNVAAHKELYETINDNKDKFDYFVKLDADMEFSGEDTLISLLDFLDNDTDHFTIPVFDFFTNCDLPELHVYSNRVFFDTKNMDKLYVDNIKVTYPGKKKSEKTSHKLVLHCYNPNMEQSFFFGVHRALKVIQTDSSAPRITPAYRQYKILQKTFKAYISSRSNKDIRYYALLGASLVFTGHIDGTIAHKSTVMEQTNKFSTTIDKSLDKYFKKPPLFALIEIMGIKRMLLGLMKTITLDGPKLLKRIIKT